MAQFKTALFAASLATLAVAIGCIGGDEPASTTSTTTGGATPTQETSGTPTAQQVATLLGSRCMPCHGGAEPQEGLNLETIEGLVKGGEHGPVVVAGDAASSPVVKSLRGADGAKKMPPAASPQLTEEEIKMVEDWINAGAATS